MLRFYQVYTRLYAHFGGWLAASWYALMWQRDAVSEFSQVLTNTWLCSRAMRFQSRPTNWPSLTIESPVAQWLEHPTRSRRVVGSSPIWGSDFSIKKLFHTRLCTEILSRRCVWMKCEDSTHLSLTLCRTNICYFLNQILQLLHSALTFLRTLSLPFLFPAKWSSINHCFSELKWKHQALHQTWTSSSCNVMRQSRTTQMSRATM